MGKPAREAQTADSCQVRGDGEDVSKVHLEGVVGLLPESECRLGRCRGDDGVHLGKGLVEVPPDQRTNLLRPEVVGVIVAAAQNVGSKDDASLDLESEALTPGLCIQGLKVLRLGGALSVTDPVKSGEIRGGLRGGDDVVDGDRVLRVRQGDLDGLGAEVPELGDGRINGRTDSGLHSVDEVFLGNTDPQSLQVASDLTGEILVGKFQGSGVVRILPGHGVEEEGAVLDRGGEGADLIER